MNPEPTPDDQFRRYQRLQRFVGWTEADAARVHSVANLMRPAIDGLVDDFYATIEQEPEARKVITGGAAQIARLRVTLRQWVEEFFSCQYDRDYVARRWSVGWRHVDIGLDQVYTIVALSRLRKGLIRALQDRWSGDLDELKNIVGAVNVLLDLDLAMIEDAYQAEYIRRQQRSERLAAIGQVAGGVAHELRNPLNVVKTSVYYLCRAQTPTPEKTREHLERIERNVNIADQVITALTDFAKLPLPELQSLSLEACINDALERSPLPPTVDLTLSFPTSLPLVLGDARQLAIVFGNLIRNAGDAMPQGGRLSILAQSVGEQVELSIRDTGVGMEPQHLARITEPLFSTKTKGLGLGLSVSRAILDKHAAELHVASQPGLGSTFTVRLKASQVK